MVGGVGGWLVTAAWALAALGPPATAQFCRNVTVCEQKEVCSNDNPVKVMAFNIQVFGKTKSKKTDIMSALVKIILPYDIIMVQEIRDSSQLAIIYLLRDLNKAAEAELGVKNVFGLKVSKRQGRSSSKEQIGFLYKKSVVYPSRAMNFEDGPDDNTDAFERDPYIVEFTVNQVKPAVKSFVIIGCHIKPSDVVNELNAMLPVYEYTLEKWGNKNIVMAGDFNAGCSYLSSTKKKGLSLAKDTRFTWLIGDDADTTVADNDCAYDRFIAAGPWVEYIRDAGVVDYGKFLNIKDPEFLKDISDHYPIVMTVM